jgi:hypothetical protein
MNLRLATPTFLGNNTFRNCIVVAHFPSQNTQGLSALSINNLRYETTYEYNTKKWE